jgi:anthranilate phosphoribosyltransferase
MNEILRKLIRGEAFSIEESTHIFSLLTSEEIPDLQKSAFLAGLTVRGETVDEMAGFALSMKKAATPFPVNADSVVDTCGTGGDGSGSFNISTATALLCAAAGIKVVKHGNRSVSSRSGSADVLEALKIKIDKSPKNSKRELEELGFTFLFAQKYHPSMKTIAPVRKSLGVKTVFNLLGPLTNPANPAMQLIGAYSLHAAEMIARVAQLLGHERTFVIHDSSGWDEATPASDFHLFDVRKDSIKKKKLSANDIGMEKCALEDLKGGDSSHNAQMIEEIFQGGKGPPRDTVILNSSLVFLLTEKESEFKKAASAAAKVIDSGMALELLKNLRRFNGA